LVELYMLDKTDTRPCHLHTRSCIYCRNYISHQLIMTHDRA